MKNILEDLNEAQKLAVENIDGPIMVIAGAGSGKTRVLTYRVAYLLHKGVDAFHVLALTFTNKAAKEMKERVYQLIGSNEAKNVWMGTFHSIFARILRIEGHRLGYPSNYTIYDTDDSKNVIKQILKEQELDDKTYKPGMVLNRISSAKSSLYSTQKYNDDFEIQQQDKASGKPKLGLIFTLYNQRCFRSSAMDFDDLLYNMNVLLRDFPEVLYKYQNLFKYILVDEYQDTNFAQYFIVKQLAANNENLCVVGDDAQSIYAFRGANIQNILNFKNDYPDFKTYKLEQNYRSTKMIVNAANSVIAKNKDQISKIIWTQNNEGAPVQLMRASTENEEGQFIAHSIFENKMNHQLMNTAFAVLYRTNAQSRALEEALRRLNIPYRIYGGLSFYRRKEIKDLLAYFRLTINHKDGEALIRIINYPARSIGKTTTDKIIVSASEHEVSAWEVIEKPHEYNLGLNSGTTEKIRAFVTMIKSYAVMMETKDAYEVAKYIALHSGLMRDLNEDKTPEGISRYENIEELLNGIKEFTEQESKTEEGEPADTSMKTLGEYLQDIALLTDADADDKDDHDKVSLMTIHQAKGLEFPYVYIAGVEENLFPSIQSLGSRADLEEERRLFYVAITRAMEKVFITYAESRYKYGNLNFSEPSRFIDEIDEEFIEFPGSGGPEKRSLQTEERYQPKKSPLKSLVKKPDTSHLTRLKKITENGNNSHTLETDDSSLLQSGMDVEHERFGKGKILNIEGNGPNRKATVFFQMVGQKQLLLKFARLKILK